MVVYGVNNTDKNFLAAARTFVYKPPETTQNTGALKTKKKMTTATNVEPLSTAIPARLFETDAGKLREYEKKGLNMSLLIRRCVQRALPDVVREIREELGKGENQP